MPIRLQAVHPVLMASDIAASVQFYERLGFRLTFEDDAAQPRYAALVRDGVELHLQWHGRAQWAHGGDLPTYRILVTDVDGLFAEFERNAVLAARPPSNSPWKRPGDTPWGTREFHLRDPDGNDLQFYRPR